ncbi:MAG: hypothetical protein KC912_23795, partial [Proteobacteria bacterium]|nr:hypothetical protein [Pseudomonadota bacterium]
MTTFKPSATQTFFSIATCLQLGVAFRFGLTQGLKALLVCSFLGVSMASAGSSDLIDGPPRLSVGIAASVPSSAPVRLAPRLAQSSHGTHPGKRRAGNILLAT